MSRAAPREADARMRVVLRWYPDAATTAAAGFGVLSDPPRVTHSRTVESRANSSGDAGDRDPPRVFQGLRSVVRSHVSDAACSTIVSGSIGPARVRAAAAEDAAAATISAAKSKVQSSALNPNPKSVSAEPTTPAARGDGASRGGRSGVPAAARHDSLVVVLLGPGGTRLAEEVVARACEAHIAPDDGATGHAFLSVLEARQAATGTGGALVDLLEESAFACTW
jgi:hypothetical protein